MLTDDYREEGFFRLPLGGQSYCVPLFCPHRGGRLSHGEVNAKRRTITCPLHHSVFSLETGEQLAGPACGPLAVEGRAPPSDEAARVPPSVQTMLVDSDHPEAEPPATNWRPKASGLSGNEPMTIYSAEQIWPPFSESLLDWGEAFHDLMLNDRLRMTTYRQAIFEAVKPGDVVLDLGTGTGILSQWALEAGASRLYGIDLSAPILAQAVERIRCAGFADRFEPINQISYEVELPQQVDVLISEIIGNMADNEDFQPILQDAIRRFLKPGGTLLPRSTQSYLVPVAAQLAHRNLRDGKIASLTPRHEIAALYRERAIVSPFNLYYDCILPGRLYLSRPRLLRAYDGAWEQPATYTCTLSFTLDRSELLTGFKAYFTAELTATTTLDISGDDIQSGETSDSWKHAYLPIEQPIAVQKGDRLQVTFSRRYPPSGTAFRQVYRWQGWVERAGQIVGRFDQCMDEAALSAMEIPAQV